MSKNYNIIEFIDNIKEISKRLNCYTEIYVSFKDKGFNLDGISIYPQKRYDEIKHVDYKYMENIAEKISKKYKINCKIFIGFIGSEITITNTEKFENNILDEINLTDKDLKVLKTYKGINNSISFKIYFNNEGTSAIYGDKIDNLIYVNGVQPILEYLNIVMMNCDKKYEIDFIEYKEIQEADKVLKSLKNDLKLIKESNCFRDFLKDNMKMEDEEVSIYFSFLPISYKSISMINIFHKGYCFNTLSYPNNQSKLVDLNFKLIHSFEDLCERPSNIKILDEYVDEYGDECEDGNRVGRYVCNDILSKGNNSSNFVPLFTKYFSKSTISALNNNSDIEIFINKGLCDKVLVKKNNYTSFIAGFNENNDRIFYMYVSNSVFKNINSYSNTIKKQINKLITDIDYNNI